MLCFSVRDTLLSQYLSPPTVINGYFLFQIENLDYILCNLQKIAGADQTMQQTFTNSLGKEVPYTVERVEEAIKAVNEARLERILLFLEYIKDQGEFCSSGIN